MQMFDTGRPDYGDKLLASRSVVNSELRYQRSQGSQINRLFYLGQSAFIAYNCELPSLTAKVINTDKINSQ